MAKQRSMYICSECGYESGKVVRQVPGLWRVEHHE